MNFSIPNSIIPCVIPEKGLTPVPSSSKIAFVIQTTAGVVQLVECLLAKEKVVGSSPIARSKQPKQGCFYFGSGRLRTPIARSKQPKQGCFYFGSGRLRTPIARSKQPKQGCFYFGSGRLRTPIAR